MHLLQFQYTECLGWKVKVQKSCNHTTKICLCLASFTGSHMLPSHSSFPNHQQFYLWWKVCDRRSRTSKLALLQTTQHRLLSLCVFIYLHTHKTAYEKPTNILIYVCLNQTKSIRFSWVLKGFVSATEFYLCLATFELLSEI